MVSADMYVSYMAPGLRRSVKQQDHSREAEWQSSSAPPLITLFIIALNLVMKGGATASSSIGSQKHLVLVDNNYAICTA